VGSYTAFVISHQPLAHIASDTALLVGTVVSSPHKVVTIVLELSFIALPVVQSNNVIAQSTLELGQDTSQLPPQAVSSTYFLVAGS